MNAPPTPDPWMPERRALLERRETLEQRLDSGTYGTCDACGDPIERERLRALPTASICAFCAR